MGSARGEIRRQEVLDFLEQRHAIGLAFELMVPALDDDRLHFLAALVQGLGQCVGVIHLHAPIVRAVNQQHRNVDAGSVFDRRELPQLHL